MDQVKTLLHIQTDISGLDSMFYGGIPERSQVILSGSPGAGKTLLSFEFLYRNAMAGGKSILFAFDEEPDGILLNAKSAFSELTDIDRLITEKKIIISGKDMIDQILEQQQGQHAYAQTQQDLSAFQFGRLVSQIEDTVVATGANKIVIDSLSLLEIMVSNKIAYRRFMVALVSNLRRLNVISLVTVDSTTLYKSDMVFRSEDFIFDGVVEMYRIQDNEKEQLAMEIIKMRGTKHSFVTTPYEITPSGFKFYSAESV
jgi:KaiC/GvpD/RAD55 family RecA-like ATPase